MKNYRVHFHIHAGYDACVVAENEDAAIEAADKEYAKASVEDYDYIYSECEGVVEEWEADQEEIDGYNSGGKEETFFTVVLALEADDAKDLEAKIAALSQLPQVFREKVAGHAYEIYCWKHILWEGDAVDELLMKVEDMRHALYTITEDDEAWEDVNVSIAQGTDGQLEELLEVSAKLRRYAV